MRFETVFVALAMVFGAKSAIEPSSPCGLNEIYTEEKGCIKSCKDPGFKKCGDVYPALWDPKFCALLPDGTWRSYTYECQACKNTGNIGVAQGQCSGTENAVSFCKKSEDCADPEICLTGLCFNICKTSKCQGGFICVHGNCIPQSGSCRSSADCKQNEHCVNKVCKDKCWGVVCTPEQTCVNGKCRDRDQNTLNVCPADAEYKTIYCKPPRPNDRTCPNVIYVRAPDPLVCGVTSSGERINYPRECQACKNRDVVYYFDKPCHLAPPVCEKRERCLDYFCQSSCKNSEDCPFDWQTCSQGKCLDKCFLWKCASCKYGQCAYEQPSGNCFVDSQCQKDTWSCVNQKCVDLCETQACRPDQTCKKGTCYPNRL